MSRIRLASRSPEFQSRLNEALPGDAKDTVMLWPDALGQGNVAAAVDELASENPDLVLVGPGLKLEHALAIAEQFDLAHPEISIVLVATPTAEALERALRAGARGVIPADASPSDIAVTLDRVLASVRRHRQALGVDAPSGPTQHIIPVVAAKGGCGKTVTSTNLAVSLALQHPGEVVLVDMDLQFGDVETALGIDPIGTIADTLALGESLTPTALKAFLTPKQSCHLYALAAPATPAQADEVGPADVRRVLKMLSEEFRYVVVDTAAGIDEMTLECLDVATSVVVLTSMDVPSIRATAKEIDALRLLGMDRVPWHLVLNRATSKVGLSIDDIEATLGRSIDVRVPSTRAVPTSVNQGRPIALADPRAPASKAFMNLSERMNGAAARSTEQPQGWLRRSR